MSLIIKNKLLYFIKFYYLYFFSLLFPKYSKLNNFLLQIEKGKIKKNKNYAVDVAESLIRLERTKSVGSVFPEVDLIKKQIAYFQNKSASICLIDLGCGSGLKALRVIEVLQDNNVNVGKYIAVDKVNLLAKEAVRLITSKLDIKTQAVTENLFNINKITKQLRTDNLSPTFLFLGNTASTLTTEELQRILYSIADHPVIVGINYRIKQHDDQEKIINYYLNLHPPFYENYVPKILLRLTKWSFVWNEEKQKIERGISIHFPMWIKKYIKVKSDYWIKTENCIRYKTIKEIRQHFEKTFSIISYECTENSSLPQKQMAVFILTNKKKNFKKLITNIRQVEKQNKSFLHLTANEGILSNTAKSFLKSDLSQRYYFGGGKNNIAQLGVFTALGMKNVEELVVVAKLSLKKMISAEIVNLKCLSGIHAMICAILSCTDYGDVVMSISENQGGHFATKGIIIRAGRRHIYAVYDTKNYKINIDKTVEVIIKNHVKAVYLDMAVFLTPINLQELRNAIGGEVIIIYDASHCMGLIMGNKFQQPLEEGADIVCANTHKTLPGPQKGIIAFRDYSQGRINNSIINNYLVSSCHTHHLVALAITILEMDMYGVSYANQILKNSNNLGKYLEKHGLSVKKVSLNKYSENHQVHLYLPKGGNPLSIYQNFIYNQISTNFIMGDKPIARIGVQEITRRGMKEKEMMVIAKFMYKALNGKTIIKEVRKFNRSFNQVKYSFDND